MQYAIYHADLGYLDAVFGTWNNQKKIVKSVLMPTLARACGLVSAYCSLNQWPKGWEIQQIETIQPLPPPEWVIGGKLRS